MMTWKQLQAENGSWCDRNFGEDRKARWPLLGLLEELGELTHARLKREQGIRGTLEEHLANEKDAIADSIIFFADVCNTQKWSMLEIVKGMSTFAEFQKVFTVALDQDIIFHTAKHLGMALDAIVYRDLVRASGGDDKEMDARAQSLFFLYLCGLSAYCREQTWSMQELVEETWVKVRKRDWTKNKSNGDASAVAKNEVAEPSREELIDLPSGDSRRGTGTGGIELTKKLEELGKRNTEPAPVSVQEPKQPDFVHKPKNKTKF